MGKFFKVTPLRKIGIGLFIDRVRRSSSSSWIEARIQSGQTRERLVADPRVRRAHGVRGARLDHRRSSSATSRRRCAMKSFIMALFLLSTSVGNLMTAGVNHAMVKPLHAVERRGRRRDVGQARRRRAASSSGQKIDFGGDDRPRRSSRPTARRSRSRARSSSPRRRSGGQPREADGRRRSQAGRRARGTFDARRRRGVDLQARRSRSTSTSSRW